MTSAGVYQFPRPIWVDADVLGQRIETLIGPVRAVVVTPHLDASSGVVSPPKLSGVPDTSLSALIGDRPSHLDHYPSFTDVIDPEWCTEFAGAHPGTATALRAVGLEFVGVTRSLDEMTAYKDGSDQMADVAGRCLESWFSGVAQWLSILTGQDLDHREQIFDATALAAGFRAWQNGKWIQGAFSFSFPNKQPVDLTDFREVLSRAGAEQPALEWLLMHSGASALDRGNFRTAVAEFATASEVCLARLVKTSTSTAGRPGVRSNLAAWSRWLEAHEPGYAVDSQFDVGLVELRNDVVHRGIVPTYDEGRIAYSCALRIVISHGMPRAPWR